MSMVVGQHKHCWQLGITFLPLTSGFPFSSASVSAPGPWHTAATSLSCTQQGSFIFPSRQLVITVHESATLPNWHTAATSLFCTYRAP